MSKNIVEDDFADKHKQLAWFVKVLRQPVKIFIMELLPQ